MNYLDVRDHLLDFIAVKPKFCFVLFVLFMTVIFSTIKSHQSDEKVCKVYCLAKIQKSKLPTEEAYFHGIDNYEIRYPELVRKFRAMKKRELEQAEKLKSN
jgi:hypothetical protein